MRKIAFSTLVFAAVCAAVVIVIAQPVLASILWPLPITPLGGTGSGSVGGVGGYGQPMQMACSIENVTKYYPNHWPDIFGNYIAYSYHKTTFGAGQCKCAFAPKIAPGSCNKACAAYGAAGQRCMADSDCNSGQADYSYDIFLYDSITKQETAVSMLPANEYAPSVYGNKVVWYVQGKEIAGSWYDSATDTYVNRRKISPGSIMLYDIDRRTTSVLGYVNEMYMERPKIYDDTVVWSNAEKYNINVSFVENVNGTDKKSKVDIDVVGRKNVYLHTIPLKRTDRLTGSGWGVVVYLVGISHGSNVTLVTSLSDGVYTLKEGELLDVGGYVLNVTRISSAPGGADATISVCDGNGLCALPVDINRQTAELLTSDFVENVNPDLYEEKVVYQLWHNGFSDIVLYDRASGMQSSLTNTKVNEAWPKVFRTRAIWTEEPAQQPGSSVIVLYDLENGEKVKMSSSTLTINEDGHDLYGSDVVWSNSGLKDIDIMRNRTSDPKKASEKITVQLYDDLSPSVYGPLIVWENLGWIQKYQCANETVPEPAKCSYVAAGVGYVGKSYANLTFSGQTADSVAYKASLSSGCRGRLLQLKKGVCSGPVVSECVIGSYPNSFCTGAFTPPKVAGTYYYVLCDPREKQASAVAALTVK